MTTTTTPAAVPLHRSAFSKPQSVNEAERSVDLIIATETPIDGISLSCRRQSVILPDAPVPVMLDHSVTLDRMAGRLIDVRCVNGQVLGRAVFKDAPAADLGFQIASAGVAVSVGAEYFASDLQPSGKYSTALKWGLRSVALCPAGKDQLAVTRSMDNPASVDTSTTGTAQPPAASEAAPVSITPEPAKSADSVEMQRQAHIWRVAAQAGVATQMAQHYIDSGLPAQDFVDQVLRSQQPKIPGTNIPVPGYNEQHRSHPMAYSSSPIVTMAYASPAPQGLEAVLRAKMGVKDSDPALAKIPLDRAISDWNAQRGIPDPYVGNNPKKVINRAWSTSDFSDLLLSTAERSLLDGYEAANQGIRALSRIKILSDFRPSTELRLSMFGDLGAAKPEGGDYTAGNIEDEKGAVLAASEYGKLVKLTRRALQNDDLSAWSRLVSEMGSAAARSEAVLLAEQLDLINWDAKNSTSDTDVFNSISAATVLLRRQTDANGIAISFTPRLLVVAPEQETTARQLLSEFNPTTADEVMPYKLALEVDAAIPDKTCYLADTNYAPLLLGKIGDPVVSQEEDFDSGSRKFRVQHDCCAAIADTRSVVKITIAPAEPAE